MEIEGFELDYAKEDYTTQFRDAMKYWKLPDWNPKKPVSWENPSWNNPENIKKAERIIQKKLGVLNRVSAIYIQEIIKDTYNLYYKVGQFIMLGEPIIIFKELTFSETITREYEDTILKWKDPIVYLRRTNGRPLKLKEKYN